MRNFKKVCRYVFIPTLLGSLVVIAFYTAIHYLIDIRFHLANFKSIMVNCFLPIAFSIAFTYIFVRHRLRILRLSEKLRDLLVFSFGIALAAATIAFQLYFVTKIERITSVASAEVIDDLPETRYYNIQSCETLNGTGVYWVSYKITDRNQTQYTVEVHFACPVPDTSGAGNLHIWVGKTYKSGNFNYKTRNDSLQIAEVERFIDSSHDEFMSYAFSKIHYFERLQPAEISESYLPAIKASIGDIPDELILLIPAESTYENRTGFSLEWFIGIFLIGQTGFFLMIFRKSVDIKNRGRGF